MNILYVHNVAKIGGAERVTLDIIRGLDGGPHQAFLVTPEKGPFLDAARELGANVCALDIQQPDVKKPIQTVKAYRRWLKFLREHEIDLIHTGDLFVTRTLVQPAKKLAIPLVCHVHFPVEVPALNWIFKTRPYQCHFVYCSHELHETVSQRVETVLRASSHQVIHNGVDVDLFKPFSSEKRILPPNKTNIGIVANLQERKGHLDLIEAISKLHPNYPDIRVHIIGGDLFGDSRERLLKERITELGLDNLFVFHGQVKNVRDYLNELDIVVCASHQEAFPISMLEAMAFDLPIVTTDVNGIPEAIRDDESGLLFPAQDTEAMACALEKLLENPEKRRRLGRHARVRVVEQFSQVRFQEKLSDFYRQAEEWM